MTDRPNIIFLMMDSVRAANVSCYGYERPTTPTLDALAEEGMLFEQAFSVGCWTLPVHTSLFTGLYPYSHGITISKNALPTDFPTLAGHLKGLGYETACFSNNAYVSEITNLTQGFDTVEEIWRVTNPRGIERTKMSRLRRWLEQFGPVTEPIIAAGRQLKRMRTFFEKPRRREGDSGARLTNLKIESWLSTSRDEDKPFFMFVNYMEPHEPYNPPQPYDRRFMPKRYSPRRVAQVGNNNQVMEQRSHRELYEENLEIICALYDGELSYLDQQIGEIIEVLTAHNLLDDTVVVVTSDHGDSLGEHKHIGHRTSLYEPLVHVPLIIRYPARFQPGTRWGENVSLIDLYPTLLELAGAEPSLYSGNGFYSLVAPPLTEKRPYVIAENTAPKSMNSVVARMLRTDRYKFIWKSDQQHELYDLRQDPGELTNLIDRRPDVARDLEGQLTAWVDTLGSQSFESDNAHYGAEVREHLQKLGYVD